MLSVQLDVVLGVLYVYLFFSLLAAGVNEAISRWRNWRENFLQEEIARLLGSEAGDPDSLAAQFGRHGLVSGLADGTEYPDCIPPAIFAMALMDIGLDFTNEGGTRTVTVKRRLKPREAQVLSALAGGDSEPGTISLRIQKWFGEAGTTQTARYKRDNYRSLVLVSILLSLAFCVDTIHLTQSLYRDGTLREVVVKQAASATAAEADIPAIPIGWRGWPADTAAWSFTIGGCLLSAFAMTFGAPFWFDLLSRLVSLRRSSAESGSRQTFVSQ